MSGNLIAPVSGNLIGTPVFKGQAKLNNNNVGSQNQESIFADNKFKEIEDKQGFLGKTSNAIKEFFHVGVSSADCKEALDKYKNGQISYDAVMEMLDKYNSSQDSNINLISNILTGIASIAVATTGVKAGHISWKTAANLGAPVGIIAKTGLKMADRASNNVKNDEWNAKEIAKDVISGAVTGTTSAVSSNIGIGIKKRSIMTSIKNGTECGILCGALSGATNYATDVALDNNKRFDRDKFIENTCLSAFISGTVGGVVGAGVYGLTSPAQAAATDGITKTIVKDSASSSSRKLLGRAEKDALNIV